MEAFKNAEEQAIRIEQAKMVLKNAGYYVDNLWSVADVQEIFECSQEEAMTVLNRALTNEATTDQIWLAIYVDGDYKGYHLKNNSDENPF